ncbi:hypothetical protein V6N12_065611 [Hibiscus sabdariffa]|uniref:CCHC-type domain-containing protein n=1 Tax=Hibiscus sabdariffa TaxID=183260 RepID=A0ABR2G976_9ROSI
MCALPPRKGVTWALPKRDICLMLATMTPELQKQHEYMVAYEMIPNLKEIYEGQARQERYETSKALFQCKMIEGSSVGAQTLPQLLGMLRTAESDLKKNVSKSTLMIRKAKGKGKKVAKTMGNGKTKPKGKKALKPKGGISKEGKCFHCDKSGHWKRNCHVCLEEVKKAKAVGVSTFGKVTKAPFNGKGERHMKSSRNSKMKYKIDKAKVSRHFDQIEEENTYVRTSMNF